MAARVVASPARRRAAPGAGEREVTTPPGSPVGDRRTDMERFLQDIVSWQGGSQEELAAKAGPIFKFNLAETPEAVGMLEAPTVCWA